MNILDFQKMKTSGQKITVLTCYDYWSAQILADSAVDCILVGDSAAMVMHGEQTTVPATMDMMAFHIRAVVKGAPKKFVIGDLPFASYRLSLTDSILNAQRLMQAGCHAVKLEGAAGNLELIERMVQSGIPVMGHLGLTPQSVNQLGGFKVQGREERAGEVMLQQAIALQEAGCFSMVLECVPKGLAEKITGQLSIPTIGIGAGHETDGQVLVLQDMLGMQKDVNLKLTKRYLQGYDLMLSAVNEYCSEVKTQDFPSDENSF